MTAMGEETVVHRLRGGSIANLRLSAFDRQETPPGISVLIGGTAAEAADQMRQAFPNLRKWQPAMVVGTTTVRAIRVAGFDLLLDPTKRFSNHGRLIHPQGESGFTDDNLAVLAQAFQDTSGC
jgi:hypothetical protein